MRSATDHQTALLRGKAFPAFAPSASSVLASGLFPLPAPDEPSPVQGSPSRPQAGIIPEAAGSLPQVSAAIWHGVKTQARSICPPVSGRQNRLTIPAFPAARLWGCRYTKVLPPCNRHPCSTLLPGIHRRPCGTRTRHICPCTRTASGTA